MTKKQQPHPSAPEFSVIPFAHPKVEGGRDRSHPAMSAHQSSGVAHPQRWWNYNIPDKRAQKTDIKETGRIAPEAFTFITNLIHLPLLRNGKRGMLGNSNAAQFVRKSNASVSSITRRGAPISVTNKTEPNSGLCEIWRCFIFLLHCMCMCGRATEQAIGIIFARSESTVEFGYSEIKWILP